MSCTEFRTAGSQSACFQASADFQAAKSAIPKEPGAARSPASWYLGNATQVGPAKVMVYGINVLRVWKAGYRGKNSSAIVVVDDGVQLTHQDLRGPRLIPALVYDTTTGQSENTILAGPCWEQEKYTNSTFNCHGTKCAGLVMANKNDVGAVGVAFEGTWTLGTLGPSGVSGRS